MKPTKLDSLDRVTIPKINKQNIYRVAITTKDKQPQACRTLDGRGGSSTAWPQRAPTPSRSMEPWVAAGWLQGWAWSGHCAASPVLCWGSPVTIAAVWERAGAGRCCHCWWRQCPWEALLCTFWIREPPGSSNDEETILHLLSCNNTCICLYVTVSDSPHTSHIPSRCVPSSPKA